VAVDEREQVLAVLNKAVQRSPVLKAFRVEAHALRGRFYLHWHRKPAEEAPSKVRGRITPLTEPKDDFLLEVEHRQGRWSVVAQGSIRKLMNAVTGDRRGTFHGLGSLDKSLRKVTEEGERLKVQKTGLKFVYAGTGESLSAQEALYHYFGLPIPVIAEPAYWYSRHRTPHIVECSEDRTRVLVRHISSSWSGETFGGTCLYLEREGEWGAYTIRPNQSQDIATAERWLVKRKWKAW
jgi:hypothetical protein